MKKLITILSLVSTISTLGVTALAVNDTNVESTVQKVEKELMNIKNTSGGSLELDKVMQGKKISTEESQLAIENVKRNAAKQQEKLTIAIAGIEKDISDTSSDEEKERLSQVKKLLIDRLNETQQGADQTIQLIKDSVE
jgi:hypothetical protein